jgi:protease I
MKRLTLLVIVLTCFTVLCFGQRRTRTTQLKIIQLTEPILSGQLTFEETLVKRRNINQFNGQSLTRTELGQLAWAGQGIIDKQTGLRTAPPVGSIYPMELLLATEEGIFAYRPTEHSLQQTSEQDIRSVLAAGVATQEQISGAGCCFIIAGDVRQLTPLFGNRARTYVAMEAGYITQNIQLQAVSLELGSTVVVVSNPRDVGRLCGLARTMEPLCLVFVGHPSVQETTQQGGTVTKRAALIIASENFRDEELFETKRVLDAAQIETVIASSRTGIIRGSLGNLTEARVLVNQLRIDDYDAIVFIGGPGVVEYVNNPVELNIIRETVRKGKILAAIGTAPTILANANVLAGLRATSLLSEREILTQAGAIYTGVPVEQDRLIITASGPAAAVMFGRAIADALVM